MRPQLRSERSTDGVVTLWLSQPTRQVIVLDKWLLGELHSFFDWLDAQAAPTGFVLMSDNPRTFVAGADLAEIDSLDDAALHDYLANGARAFARITQLPCPSVACVHQTVLGGGLEIAMHCDALIAQRPAQGAKPWRLGLVEATMGLCPGWGGTQMLPARIDPAAAIRATALGTTWTIDQPPVGLFAEVVGFDADLREAGVQHVKQHARTKPSGDPVAIDARNREAIAAALVTVEPTLPATPSTRAVVEAVRTGLDHGWSAALAAERRLLVGLRHTPEARERLDAFLKKSSAPASR